MIERINLTINRPFEDGEHILYVNGEYRGKSDLGKLMHDFNCTNAADMNYEIMAERTRYLKENPRGVKWSAEQAMAAMKIPTSEQEKYKSRL